MFKKAYVHEKRRHIHLHGLHEWENTRTRLRGHECSDCHKESVYSPKKDTMFVKLKEEMVPGTPGSRTLCPARRAISLKSVLDNYIPLKESWEDCLEEKLDSETKSRIIGVKSQMSTFEYYFGLHLGFLIFGHTDNLS